jgi:hypothetical protein
MYEKNPCLLAPWLCAEAIFLRPGQGVNMNLLLGGEDFTRHRFERDAKENFKGVGGP